MSLFKVIISLPIIAIKLVWRFALVVLVSFPVTGFFIVPAVQHNDFGSLTIVSIVIAIIALILSIRVWKQSYDESRYGQHWKW